MTVGLATGSIKAQKGQNISLSSLFSVSSGANDPQYLILSVLDGAGSMTSLTGNGTTANFANTGNVVFTYNAATGQYVNSVFGNFANMTIAGVPGTNFNDAVSLFSTNNAAVAQNAAHSATLAQQASLVGTVNIVTPVVTLAQQTGVQSWADGTAVSFTLPAGTFKDSAGGALTLTATQNDGSALPSWLHFNAATGTFSGNVPVNANGMMIKVTAVDSTGASASDSFFVANPLPTVSVAAQTPTQSWMQGQSVVFAVPAGTFADSAHESFVYSAVQANGQGLPGWLGFDGKTGTFFGTVPANAGPMSVKVYATDQSGVSTSETFTLNILPVASVAVTAQTPVLEWPRGTAISYNLAANTFTDSQNQALTYTATQNDGSALPAWLSFNGATRTFSGNVPVDANGMMIKVTATDATGASASESFFVGNPMPVLTVADQTATQNWTQGAAVSFAIPTGTFADSANETLVYSAVQSNGQGLPGWLGFDGKTGTFSGTAPADAAPLTITVYATDQSGVSNSETFAVNFAAPAASNPTTGNPTSGDPTQSAPATSLPSTQAMRASDFLNTLGVNTHIPYTDGQYVNLQLVESDLAYLGINQVRDSISNGANGSAPYSSYLTLAQAGIHFTFIASGATTADLQNYLGEIATLNQAVPGSVTAVEGTNEINNAPVTYNGVGGLQGAVDMQRAIYSYVHSSAALAGVPVDYFTGYAAGNVAAGPDPATTPGLADYDTQHPYPNFGQAPAAWINPATVLTNENGTPGPAVYTETGYTTVGTGSNVVNQDVQAKYSVDLFLDAAKDGVSKTYLYQLLDAYAPNSPQGDDGYGLFDNSKAPKEAAVAIHDLTTILADPGATAATFTAGSLSYSITGLPSTGNSMLMEKSSGVYDLAIWNEPQIWNATTQQEISVASTPVTVQLGTVAARVDVYDPITGSAPIETLTNVSSVQLGLSADPLIVEVTPAQAPGVANLTNGQVWMDNQAVNFKLAANTFSDPQGQALTLSADQVGSSSATSWLHFDAASGTFSGTAPAGTQGTVTLEVVATNAAGLSVAESFNVTMASTAAQFSQAAATLSANPGAGSVANATLPPSPNLHSLSSPVA